MGTVSSKLLMQSLTQKGKATWSQHYPLNTPLSRSAHGVTYNPRDDSVYMWGGEHKARHAIDSIPWRLSKGPDGAYVWNQLTTTDEPEARVAHDQVIEGNFMYIWGGRQGEALGEKDMCDIYKLNLKDGQWTQLETKGDGPVKRSFHQMCSTEGKLHLFGGCAGHDRLADL